MKINFTKQFGFEPLINIGRHKLLELVAANPEMQMEGEEAAFYSEDTRFAISYDVNETGALVFGGTITAYAPKRILRDVAHEYSVEAVLESLADEWREIEEGRSEPKMRVQTLSDAMENKARKTKKLLIKKSMNRNRKID